MPTNKKIVTKELEMQGKRFVEILNTLKLQEKLTQKKLAKEVAYKSDSSITEMKGGRQSVTTEILEYLQKKYSVNPDYITKGILPIFGEGGVSVEINFVPILEAIAELQAKTGRDYEVCLKQLARNTGIALNTKS